MFSVHHPWNGLERNGSGTFTILFRVGSGSKSSPFDLADWGSSPLPPPLCSHSLPAAASILLWHREQDEFVKAAAVVKWRAQNGRKWVRSLQTKGEQLSVSTTKMWTDHYETPIYISELIIYIPQHIRDMHHKSWCQCAACCISLER